MVCHVMEYSHPQSFYLQHQHSLQLTKMALKQPMLLYKHNIMICNQLLNKIIFRTFKFKMLPLQLHSFRLTVHPFLLSHILSLLYNILTHIQKCQLKQKENNTMVPLCQKTSSNIMHSLCKFSIIILSIKSMFCQIVSSIITSAQYRTTLL